jgi:succinate dehydrogenase hydrophobic anchor subunit
MMNFDIFISYPHENKAAADAACAALEAAGVRCWIAPRDIEPGTEWASSIIDAIDHCTAMVLIFSSFANESKQIRREVQRAFDKEVPVVPLRVENVVPEKSLAYFMGPVHWLDALSPPLEQHLQNLVSSAKALVSAKDGSGAREKPLVFGVTGPTLEKSTSPVQPAEAKRHSDRPREPVSGPLSQPAPSALEQLPSERDSKNAAMDDTAAGFSIAPFIPNDVEHHITTGFVWTGSLLLGWWLIGVSEGPGAFTKIVWLTNSLIGWAILGGYVLSVLMQALRGTMKLVRMPQFESDDLVVVANAALMIIFFACAMVFTMDHNHARSVQVLGSPLIILAGVLFAVTNATQMWICAQVLINYYLSGDKSRQLFGMAIKALCVLVAIVMIYALFIIKFGIFD